MYFIFYEYIVGVGYKIFIFIGWDIFVIKENLDYVSIVNGGIFVSYFGMFKFIVMSFKKVFIGKWVWEVRVVVDVVNLFIGIGIFILNLIIDVVNFIGYVYRGDGIVSIVFYGVVYIVGDIIIVLFDLDVGILLFMKNGVD